MKIGERKVVKVQLTPNENSMTITYKGQNDKPKAIPVPGPEFADEFNRRFGARAYFWGTWKGDHWHVDIAGGALNNTAILKAEGGRW